MASDAYQVVRGAPCDGCALTEMCARERMACAAFLRFIGHGSEYRVRDVVDTRRPMRRFYELAFGAVPVAKVILERRREREQQQARREKEREKGRRYRAQHREEINARRRKAAAFKRSTAAGELVPTAAMPVAVPKE
jgi:hypothetical protein